jgi:hypothetical protein
LFNSRSLGVGWGCKEENDIPVFTLKKYFKRSASKEALNSDLLGNFLI